MRSEAEFREWLAEELRRQLNGYVVRTNANLIYRVVVDDRMNYIPADPKNPARGRFAFQTDVLIENDKGVPLVVIETKYGSFSTHDVLTYSTKALKHKEVYPHLRYGLIVGNQDHIDRRLFVHNVGLDFAYAINSDKDIPAIAGIIDEQISAAEWMIGVIYHRKRLRGFSTHVKEI